MPALSFNHFNLRADGAMTRKLRDFYVDIVGMTEGWRPPFPFPGHWLYLGDTAVPHLVEDDSATLVQAGRSCALDHVAFSCTGASSFERRLQERGIEYRRVLVPGTTQVQLFVNDPSGNGVEFNFASSDA
jgi:catechol 2,3-dioxygenase-like lactoylglutathione lyase family enzyme